MNADIRISVDFWSHPKTGRLMRAAGVRGVRSLQILWMWAARNRPDGRLSGFDAADIEFAADWRGKKGAFFAAVRGEWLDETDEGCALHDWQEHNPWAADADLRSQKALFSKLAQVNPEAHRALKARGIGAISRDEYESWKAERGGGWPAADRRTAGGWPANAPRTPGESLAPSPSPSPKEEKEREVRETASGEIAAGPPAAPTRSLVSQGSVTVASAPAIEIGEAREDGGDETLAANEAPASTAIAIAPEASGTADLGRDPPETAAPAPVEQAVDRTTELAVEPVAELAVEPGSVADEPRDAESAAFEPVATALADTAPSDPAPAALAAPAPRPDPAGDATRHPADGAADRPDARSVAPDAERPHRRRSPEPAAMPDPPPWLPRALWERWQAHRRALKKPVTADGALMTLAQLEKAKSFGHDPAELLETAIANGWQGCVFADRHYRPAPAPSATGTARESARRPLRDVPTDPAVYLETVGFETELAAREEA